MNESDYASSFEWLIILYGNISLIDTPVNSNQHLTVWIY